MSSVRALGRAPCACCAGRTAWAIAWLAIAGCAGSASPGTTARVPSSPVATELAPDFVARAQALHERAREAASPAREQLLIAADLWLAAGELEAESIALARRRRELEDAREASLAAQADLEARRAELTDEMQRLRATETARQNAQRLVPFTVSEPRTASETERVEAARFLLERARLLLAAAAALAAPEASTSAARTEIDRAMKAAEGHNALALSKLALSSAETALGQARAARSRPNEQEIASLMEAATERKLAPRALERGIGFEVTGFAGARLTNEGQAQLAHLSALLRMHPHGGVKIEALASHGPKPARVLASARCKVVARTLSAHGHAARVELAQAEPATGNPTAAEPTSAPLVVLTAYHMPARAPAASP